MIIIIIFDQRMNIIKFYYYLVGGLKIFVFFFKFINVLVYYWYGNNVFVLMYCLLIK